MSKFDACLTSLSLRDSVPVDALRATAAEYQVQGMDPSAAMQRAVEEQLQLAQMEEAKVVRTVREQWEAQGGAPRPAPQNAPQNIPENIPEQAAAEVAAPAEPKPAPAESAPAPIQAEQEAAPFKLGEQVHFSSGIYSNENGNGAEGVVESISQAGRIVVRAENGAGFGVNPADYGTLSEGRAPGKTIEQKPPVATKARQPNGSDSTKAEELFKKPAKPAKPKAPALLARDKKIAEKEAAPKKLKNYSWDAVKLSDAYSFDELNELRQQIETEHKNPLDDKGHPLEGGKPSIHLYDKAGRAKLDKLARAVSYKLADKKRMEQKGELRASMADRRTRTIEVDGVRRPITNSRGQLVAQDFAGQKAFWEFYKDGPVDERGQPLVLFHGTASDFSRFDPDADAVNDTGYMGAGAYFTTDANDAANYATMASDALYPAQGDGDVAADSRVLPVYLSVRNPYRMSKGDQGTREMERDEVIAWTDALKSRGYDGVVNEAGNEWVAFSSAQIKSAVGNAGTFDASNPDIRAAANAQPSGMDGQVAQAIRDGITVDKLLALIEAESGNADNRALAAALRAQQLQTKIEFGTAQGNYASGNAEQANASYRPATDTAYLHRDGGAEQSMLHELVHAATLRALGRGGRAAQQIKALHRYVKDLPSFKGYYGITDPEEFIAEAMTSPAFRQQLTDTPAPGIKLSVWQKLVGIVRMVLGLPAAQENVLTRVMAIAPDLMAENQAKGEIPAQGMRASAQWASEAFRKWFGDSKVVNDKGEPLVVYHGSKVKGLTEFSKESIKSGVGFWFGTDKDFANGYRYGVTKRGKTTTGDLVEAYLSIKNPATTIEEYHRGVDESGRPYDGYIPEGAGIYVAFNPSQIKSVENNGNFDPNNADIRASMPSQLAGAIGNGLSAASLQELPGKVANRLSDFRNVGLQFLGRRQLVDLYAGQFQAEGKESTLARYSNLMQQMDADKNEAGAEADGIADRWGKLADADKLADLMHDSTLAQIDPTKDHIAGDDKAEHSALQRRLKALSPEGQALYKEARDAYHKHWMKVRAEIRNRIERAMPESPRRAKLLEKMDATFYEKVKGVYFPLARFGDYVVTVTNAAGERQSVNFAETTNEAEALRRELLKKFPAAGGHVVSKITKKKEFNPGRDAVSRGFMQELFGVLDQYEDSAELQDDINQLYLQSMPDLSWTKHGIHRKGTPGYSQDARRAFAQNLFHGARYLAKLRYGDRLADFLDEMQDHVDAKATDEAYDSVRAQQVVDEMVKRHEAYMNPKGNQLSNTLTSLGFIFYLGLSPASAVVNLTQTPLVTLPMLAAKHGFGKASAALLAAAKQTAGAKNDISKVLQGDELRAYQQAVDAGVIDVSMAHDLAGIASGDDTKAHGKLRPVMKWASFMFHHGEKFNRQASLLAAYRLARDAGANHDAAYKAAVEDVYASHFDYSSGNRARVMQGPVARVVLLFKQYAQNMIYTLTRNAVLAVKGDKVAQKTLAGLLISHAMAAGVLGLPVVGTLLSAATMIGGDDDEPWDAKVALRNYIADLIGQKPAEVLMHGFSRLTPFDISGRVGLDKLILPDVQEGLEGARAAEAWMTAALGPVAGIGLSASKGLTNIAEGNVLRGLEDMMPVSVRNPLKALRLNSEGVKDKTGIPILDDTSAMEELGQLIGFSPSRSREAMEGKSAVYRAEHKLLDRRAALVEQWAHARQADDAAGAAEVWEQVQNFNAKNPARRITMPNLVQSLRSRNKRIREAEDGVYLPKKHADVRDLGRFATAGD